jgi:NSS family neurotransmitter:Na+ symporter
MAQLLEEQRESWGTRGGFILAAVGSAVGLGNLWGFPYKVYKSGGAAFLIPYAIAIFVIGVPVMMLEFSVGHFTQRAAPNAFCKANRKLEFIGWWGIILGFVIITFYPVILAYCFSFLWHSLRGILDGGTLPWAGKGVAGVKDFFYNTYLNQNEGQSLGAIQWHIVLTLLIAWVAMYFCIFRGVKMVGKIVWLTVPLPWLMLVMLTVNGFMLEGSIDGLSYYLVPDWSKLLDPLTWQGAFGQAFFSLSLAFGVMVTYASFLHRKSDINNNAAIIGIADFATSFIAGLAIFATMGYMSLETGMSVEKVLDEPGWGLAFVAFPYALTQLPGSAWWSFLFFFMLVTLGIDSAFSITESVLTAVIDKTGFKRKIVLPVMSIIGFSFGLIFVTQDGLRWLGVIADNIYGTWGIGFVGMLECIALGWFWRLDILRRHANIRSDWKVSRVWDFLIRILIPVILGTLFIWALYADLTKEGGFLRDAEGRWVIKDCVGFSVMILTPVLAIILTLVRSKNSIEQERVDIHKGRAAGFIGLAAAIAANCNNIFMLVRASSDHQYKLALWISLLLSVLAVWLGLGVLEKFNREKSQASWLGRWAGALGCLGISGFIATWLIYFTTLSTVEISSSSRIYELVGVVLVAVIVAIIWCTLKALIKNEEPYEPQLPEEIGDEQNLAV